jgi:hypothetical protein
MTRLRQIHMKFRARFPYSRALLMKPIYYCATGTELPAFELCRDRKDQRDI